MSEEYSNIDEKEFHKIIILNNEKKILKPLKKVIGLFNIIILINFFILQFNGISHFNFYLQLLLNEIICIYLWIEIREIKIKMHIYKTKLIIFIVLIFDIIYFLYQLKTFPSNILKNNNNNKIPRLDFIMLFIIYLSDISFNIICLLFIYSIGKFFNNINNNI